MSEALLCLCQIKSVDYGKVCTISILFRHFGNRGFKFHGAVIEQVEFFSKFLNLMYFHLKILKLYFPV